MRSRFTDVRIAQVVGVIFLSSSMTLHAVQAAETGSDGTKTVFWESAHLAAVRANRGRIDPQVAAALKHLKENADAAISRGPYSVMQKDEVAPSGDKHDYLSYGRYWWPNPKTPTGLPYVRRDGRTNEEALRKGDRGTIGNMYDDVETLSLAGYLLDESRYSDRAAVLVRAWFLDPATRMNPHMRFGQAIPGQSEGRGSGIIDTRHFIRVLDSVALLNETSSWTADDQRALVTWMKQYLDWLEHDPQAADERGGHNNHGTWYDAQVASIAMFVGERDTARRIIESAKSNRIAVCIEPDGTQPEELARTKSLHYSVFNLSAMSVLARIGEHVDVDLWNYRTSDGRSIRSALGFLIPYLAGRQKWPHEQISEISVSPSDLGLFFLASARYQDSKYRGVLGEKPLNSASLEYAPLLFSTN